MLMIPSLIIGAIYAFAGKSETSMQKSASLPVRYTYRLLGLCVFIALIYLVKGADIAGSIWGWLSK
jgi:hypothetical protein